MKTDVMGIVNVTPDSFSDGGKFFSPEEALRRARNVIAEGGRIIDLGGESTRPGATPLAWDEEWARVEPVLALLLKDDLFRDSDARLSIDTYHPETARLALEKGVTILNCVYENSVPAMLALLDEFETAELVLPARLPDPLKLVPPSRRESLLPRLYLDPMIGFGTTREEDLRLLKETQELAAHGRVLVGASRKRIVKRLTGEKVLGKDLAGNLTIALWAALKGASVVRVHDVRETVQALKVLSALAT